MIQLRLVPILSLLLILGFTHISNADSKTIFTIQESCKNPVKLAGFVMAREKGFYRDVGLDIRFRKLDEKTMPMQAVLQGKADFSLSNSEIILTRIKGKPLVILANFFKRSSSILVVDKDISSPQDLIGKRVMISDSALSGNIGVMLKKIGIQTSDLHIVRHTRSMEPFIRGQVDAFSTCSGHHTYSLDKRKIKYNVFNPSTYAIYEHDLHLFTLEKTIQKHPEKVAQFVQATIRGWEYALKNLEETANIFYHKYNTINASKAELLNQANTIKSLFLTELYPIGFVDTKQIEMVANRLIKYKYIDKVKNLDGLIYSRQHLQKKIRNNIQKLSLNQNEIQYLTQKQKIKMCVDPDWMPFEKIDRNGRHIGMAADYIALINEKIENKIQLIPTKTWQESVQLAKERKCDIFSLAMSTKNRLQYMNFTTPYISFPFVIATREEELFVENIEQVLDKTLAGVENYAFVEILKQRYPHLRIVEVKNIDDGLELVRQNKVFGMIGTLPTLGYKIQANALYDIKIAGKLKDIWALGVGVRNDDPTLFSIMQKGVDSISSEDHIRIKNRWLSVKVEKDVDYTLVWRILLIATLLIAVIIFRYHEVAKYNKNLKNLNKKLEQMSITDNLTGLFNRYRMDESLRQELERSRRYGSPFSLILLDIDNFKSVNDEFGHNTGDQVLKKVAHILKTRTRRSDIICRWGGEEFLILSVETRCLEAEKYAEYIRKQMELFNFDLGHNLTASFGVAEYRGQEKVEEIIKYADEAMYKSKKTGRNRVSVHESCH